MTIITNKISNDYDLAVFLMNSMDRPLYRSTFKIDFSNNPNITDRAAESLALVVEKFPELKILDLSNTKIMDEGIIAICNAIKDGRAPKLNFIKIINNKISDSAIQALAEAAAIFETSSENLSEYKHFTILVDEPILAQIEEKKFEAIKKQVVSKLEKCEKETEMMAKRMFILHRESNEQSSGSPYKTYQNIVSNNSPSLVPSNPKAEALNKENEEDIEISDSRTYIVF